MSIFPAERIKETIAPPDDEPEVVLWRGGYSARAMYASWLLALSLSVVLAVICFGMGDVEINRSSTVYAVFMSLIWGGLALVLVVRKLAVRYELTTQRFVHKAGILICRTDRIELLDVDDVTFVQGILQRIFNVGTVHIASSDRTHPKLELSGIADVANVYNTIDDARRLERRRRGLHIENI